MGKAEENVMPKIGSFKRVGEEYQGEIVTLSVQAKNVRIVPVLKKSLESDPSHYVYVGHAEIGAAWPRFSSDGENYLLVALDDPSFVGPINATLRASNDGLFYVLTWAR
jgi:uncharacterized protein (DUF736 family)